jgi:hypothetical protein
MDPLATELDFRASFSNLQKHIPEAKCNNKVLKEQVQATYDHLLYNKLPKIVLQVLVIKFANN